MDTRIAAPHHWLDRLAAHLDASLRGASVTSVISGAGWVSLRLDDAFVWLVARGNLRLAWLDPRPLPREWTTLLGRHERSPFSAPLRGRVVTRVRVLATGTGSADGLAIELGPAAPETLCVRWFPRPGALWSLGADGAEHARLGRMEGEALHARDGEAQDFDASAHADLCRGALAAELRAQTARVLTRRAENEVKRVRRRLWSLEGELRATEDDRDARTKADVLAAHLHEVPAGRDAVTLEDFEGRPLHVELDPALPTHVNLERWYRRAAKAERKHHQVQDRVVAARAALELAERRATRLQTMLDADVDLAALLEWAHAESLSPVADAPRPASERGRPDPERLPYWSYEIGSWEIRVGRSASDNDELTARHSHPRDLWLHAQGVPGSHVVIRCAGRQVPGDVIADAARLAAHFSRARTSATVPVLVAERRHVRKPRKAAPGMVSVERSKTLFVEPAIVARCRRRDEAEGDDGERR